METQARKAADFDRLWPLLVEWFDDGNGVGTAGALGDAVDEIIARGEL